jgi:hypothetical protein
MVDNLIKVVFKIEFSKYTHNIEMCVKHIHKNINEYNGKSEISGFLYKTNDEFLFKKFSYFIISEKECIIPCILIDGVNSIMYKSTIICYTEDDRINFLNKLRKNLIEFSMSDVFKDIPTVENKIDYYKDYWIIY